MTKPLVSVVVVAYNSARYIRETLDSILAQRYTPMELIVADDASTDDTVAVVRAWLSEHGDRLGRSALLAGNVNLGVAGNGNRALAVARGEWLKLIAADDVLAPNCLSHGLEHAGDDVSVLFSRMQLIDSRGNVTGEYRYPRAFFTYPAEKQLKCLLHRNCLAAPTALIRMTDLRALGGFDEAFPMMEDLPLWIRLLENGKRLAGLEKITVRYRVHESLVYPVIGKRSSRYQKTIADFDKQVRVPLARRLSPLLFVTVRLDLAVDYIVQRPWLYRLTLPVLWLWAHCSPYRVPAANHPAHA